MKAFWQLQARRIDALSLRERAIMFVSVAVALMALADWLAFSPMMARQKALTAQLQKHSREMDTLRQRVAAAAPGAQPDTPVGRLHKAVAQASAERDALDTEIRRQLAAPDASPQLADLLARVLRRHERLTLVRLATAAPAGTAPASPATAAPGSPQPAANGAEPALSPVDLAVSGEYAELVAYLAEIEKALPGLRWGELRLSGASSPPALAMRVYLAGAPS
ncbi:MAG: hypothetical protein C0505_00780 [Leptothrix sp. (in: Bacteria)]|nr:hypothetical protein [Leptothrix sp. (in: b-proteobacteria)]